VSPVTRLLLDEMFSDDIAQRLRDKGHDVLVVVADPELVALPDSAVLAHATLENRVLVTKNIKDFMVLDAHYRASGSSHAGLVLVSTKTFPEDRHALGALVRSLDKLLSQGGIDHGTVVFLQR
jgi:hypothetical protein